MLKSHTREVSRIMFTSVLIPSLCLTVSCVICTNFILALLKEDVLVRNEVKQMPVIMKNVCYHEISIFALNYFCKPKLAKTLLKSLFYILVLVWVDKSVSRCVRTKWMAVSPISANGVLTFKYSIRREVAGA